MLNRHALDRLIRLYLDSCILREAEHEIRGEKAQGESNKCPDGKGTRFNLAGGITRLIHYIPGKNGGFLRIQIAVEDIPAVHQLQAGQQ